MNNTRKIEMILNAINNAKDVIRDLYRDENGHTVYRDMPDDVQDTLEALIDLTATLDNNHEKEFWWNK